ncbi:LYR motif containing protein 1-like [Watersipora subatra]|uniref:LYR motif containing protein 1-like n=1 Tax=Watersipora subatra TaxID=2589382 RepID=UPI00355C9BDC
MSHTRRVLSLYKQIIRVGKTWQSATGNQMETERESKYIIAESRRLFKQNQSLTDRETIESAIKEGESRLEIGVHYKNPWPRPTHIPQHSMLPLTARKKKKSDKILGRSKPAYMKSYNIGDMDKD